jgi:hypothetical protein
MKLALAVFLHVLNGNRLGHYGAVGDIDRPAMASLLELLLSGDSLIELGVVGLTDQHEVASLQSASDVIIGPPRSLDLILELFHCYSQLSFKFAKFLLWVHFAGDKFFLEMCKHAQETIIELVLVLDLLEVLLKHLLLELDFFVANDHLVLLREDLDPLKELGEIVSLNDLLINDRAVPRSLGWGSCPWSLFRNLVKEDSALRNVRNTIGLLSHCDLWTFWKLLC